MIFTKAASFDAPVNLTVEVLRRGRSFSSAEVRASQHGKLRSAGIVLADSGARDVMRDVERMPKERQALRATTPARVQKDGFRDEGLGQDLLERQPFRDRQRDLDSLERGIRLPREEQESPEQKQDGAQPQESEQQDQTTPKKTPGRSEIEAARRAMEKAEEELKRLQGKKGIEHEDQALRKLAEAV